MTVRNNTSRTIKHTNISSSNTTLIFFFSIIYLSLSWSGLRWNPGMSQGHVLDGLPVHHRAPQFRVTSTPPVIRRKPNNFGETRRTGETRQKSAQSVPRAQDRTRDPGGTAMENYQVGNWKKKKKEKEKKPKPIPDECYCVIKFKKPSGIDVWTWSARHMENRSGW